MRTLIRRTRHAPLVTSLPGATPYDLLALAVSGANDGLWAWDTRTDWVYRSARVQEILGQPPRDVEAPGRSWFDVMHPDDIAGYRSATRSVLKGSTARLECEYRVLHEDGSYRWLLDRAIALRNGSGRVTRMAGSVTDITQRKQAEEALRASEQRFRDYVATASDWYWETGPDHSFTVHPENTRAFGIDPDSRMGKRRWDFAADLEEEPGKWRAHVATLEARQPFRDFVFRIVDGSNQDRFVSVSGKPVFAPDGVFTGYRGSTRDVTEAVQASRRLNQAMLEARAASAAKSSFLANMSHELRTPLNAILGFSEVISLELHGAIGNPRYRDYANDILRSGRHLLELINSVLDMSKIEAGRLELSPSRVSLASVVEACLPLLRERSGEAGVALAVDLPPALPDLMAEEIRLKQIVLNLLSNAIKFTPSGGSVQLAAAIEPGGGLAIRVNDTGIGMSAEQIALARQPFHQVDNATTRRFEGTGLGLPLPERLVELHGGRLEIESAPGRGTRVAVRFPARLAIGADDEVESG